LKTFEDIIANNERKDSSHSGCVLAGRFGTGYHRFPTETLPLEQLKIDRAFCETYSSTSVVRPLPNHHSLSKEWVVGIAEVSKRGQRKFLDDLGVIIQGFLCSRPRHRGVQLLLCATDGADAAISRKSDWVNLLRIACDRNPMMVD